MGLEQRNSEQTDGKERIQTGSIQEFFSKIIRSAKGEIVTHTIKTDIPPELNKGDWIQEISLKILDFGPNLLRSELKRDLGHLSDINVFRDRFYLLKAYIKQDLLRVQEYWEVLVPKLRK